MRKYSKTATEKKRHGMHHTNIHNVWTGIKQRCFNKNSPAYKDYGGRGITVCDEWLNFGGFYKDMREGHKKGLMIDRVDNSGNYEKSNCKWVTRAEQNRNTRRNIFIEWEGKKYVAFDLANKLGINNDTLLYRFRNNMVLNVYHKTGPKPR